MQGRAEKSNQVIPIADHKIAASGTKQSLKKIKYCKSIRDSVTVNPIPGYTIQSENENYSSTKKTANH